MKCTLCNERNGNTRCEGCNTLFCLPCMNKHHDELVQQFQLLMDVRNEVKQSLDIAESTLNNNKKKVSSLNEIDRWEAEVIRRIQQTAGKARMNVQEILARYTTDIRNLFERLSADIQRRQKEGNYLENDINKVKNQLDQLKNDIENMNEKIQIDSTITNNIEWDTLIYIVEGERSSNATSELVANNDEITKKKNRLPSASKAYNPRKNNDSSSMISQREEVAEKQNDTQIPIHFTKPTSSSTRSSLIDHRRRTYPDNKCLICDRLFDDVLTTRFCPECDLKIYGDISKYNLTNRPTTTSRWRPVDMTPTAPDTGFTPDLSSTSKTRDGHNTHCPQCGYVDLNIKLNGSKHYCSECGSLISSRYYQE